MVFVVFDIVGWIHGYLLRVGIHHYQPIATLEVDGMVYMYPAPGLLGQHPGVVCWFVESILVFCTAHADSTVICSMSESIAGQYTTDLASCFIH